MLETLIKSKSHHVVKNVILGKKYKIRDGHFLDEKGDIRNAEGFIWETQTTDCANTKDFPRKEVLEKVKCFQVQSGGTHYTDMELQPLEATYLRYGLEGLKAAIHTKVDKYISRKKDDAVGQLKKAEHCLQVLIEVTEAENNGRNN